MDFFYVCVAGAALMYAGAALDSSASAAARWSGACGAGTVRCADGAGCARGYCDGHVECADGSDEPPRCTPCNRTLQGEPHVEYSVSLGRPDGAAPALPFLCHLTFSARGGVVQLTFLEFSVGRHDPDGPEPCPDGQVSVAELGRPYPGGAWCGSGASTLTHTLTHTHYYSEAATLTLTARLWRAAAHVPFALALSYRFIPLAEAVVRMGVGGAIERGAAAPGTYCTRTYSECHKRTCRLQSPNYPGIYPRNVSCYWTIWQKDIPTCKHAMISIQQDVPFKIQIKRSVSMARMNKTRRVVRAWGACGGGGARLLVYDGASTDDPLLLEWCGGDALPAVTARGPTMLVAFHAAPRAAPPPPPPAAFEIDVRVVFADADSLEYAREPTRCEFHVKAPAGGGAPRRGMLHAPTHTLPPNITCTWTFHGRPGDLVWIYFASFTEYSLVEPRKEPESEETSPPSWTRAPPHSTASPWTRLRELLKVVPASSLARDPGVGAGGSRRREACPVSVRVWDGGGELHAGCGPGRLCARASLANATRSPRPCAPPDGYVSRGPVLSLAVTSRPGTATHPLRFTLHYEFADTRLPGVLWESAGTRTEPDECARVLRADGAVWSPRSPLWLGRGGARRLYCVTRLEGGPADGPHRATLELHRVSLGGATPRCTTRPHAHTGRPTCHPTPPDVADLTHSDPPPPDAAFTDFDLDDHTPEIEKALRQIPHLKIFETPWPGYRVEVACFCDNSSWVADNVTDSTRVGASEPAPLAAWSVSGWTLEMALWGGVLRVHEDVRALHYTGAWRRERAGGACEPRAPASSRAALRLHLTPDACLASPYLLAAPAPRSVLVRVRGLDVPLDAEPDVPCRTTDRLLLYDPHSGRLVKAICPGEDESQWTQMFSSDWWSAGGGGGGAGGALLAAWEGSGGALVSALHVWRAAHNHSCVRACPELDACIGAEAWCDGWSDCPRGGDEEGGCGRLLARLAAAARGWGAAGGAAGGALAAALALCVGAALVSARRRSAARRKRADSLLRSAASTPAS